MLFQELSVVVQQRRNGILRQNVIADLLLHESKVLGDVLLQHKVNVSSLHQLGQFHMTDMRDGWCACLVLPVVLLTEPEYPVAEPEDVLVGRVLGVPELLDAQERSLAVVGLHEGRLQDPEELLEDVLLPQQLLPVAVARRHDLERVLAVLLVLLVGQEVDYVLQQARQRPGSKNSLFALH